MKHTFEEAMAARRSYYTIGNESTITDEELVGLIKSAVKHVPSAFNSQSTRVVLLLKEEHKKLWQIVKEEVKKVAPAEGFKATEEKIDGCFAAGYGTILFFEEQEVVEGLQKAFPLYQENFPVWSQQANAMHQFAIWTMLEDVGLGASLQHYNPLIDQRVSQEWNLPATWKLIG